MNTREKQKKCLGSIRTFYGSPPTEGKRPRVSPIGSPLNQRPDLKDVLKRYKTFINHLWPSQIVQRGKELAVAGFYYDGKYDLTHCGLGLWDWCSTDDPMKEHLRWFPKCEFANQLTASKIKADEKLIEDYVFHETMDVGL